MNTRMLLVIVLTVAMGASGSFATTAQQYRGPAHETARGILPPSADGVIGLARFSGRGFAVEGEGRWEFWWEMNRDRFLRQALSLNYRDLVADGSVPMFAGMQDPAEPVANDEVKDRIVPALLARLASPDPEERAIAMIALGRAGIASAFGPLRDLLERGTATDRKAAAIALGFLDEPLAAPALLAYVNRRGLSLSERSYGALALGFMRSRDAAKVLRRALVESGAVNGRSAEEFRAAVATALGMIGDRESVPVLAAAITASGARESKYRAAAAVALGRIGDPAALPALVVGLRSNRVELRRAAAEALGRVGTSQIRSLLLDVFEDDPDVQVRSLAAIALSRVGGSDAARTLILGLDKKNPRALRGFSALALGLLGEPAAAPMIRETLELDDEPSLMGAGAIASALLRDSVALPRLRDIVADEAMDDDVRGYALTALAMMGDPSTGKHLAEMARVKGASDLRRAATLALALYPNVPAGRALLASILEEQDPWVRGAAVSALVLRPDRAVMEELLDAVRIPSMSADVRKDALLALGILALRGRPSPVERLVEGLNYRSATEAIADVAYLF